MFSKLWNKICSHYLSLSNKYLLQRHGSCCSLFALCNALRYFNKESPTPGTIEWEELIDLIECRNGGALATAKVADKLGLLLSPIDINYGMVKLIPIIICVMDPEYNNTLHATLIIGGNDKELILVNYHWENGPTIEKLKWSQIILPPKANRNAWKVSLKE